MQELEKILEEIEMKKKKCLDIVRVESEVTESEINAVIRKDCSKCRYSAASCTGTKRGILIRQLERRSRKL